MQVIVRWSSDRTNLGLARRRIRPLVVRFGLVLDVGTLASRKSISRSISARAPFLSLARFSDGCPLPLLDGRGRLKSRQRSPQQAET
jgi:hypothetical protein